jgi:hypothetical protein
MGDEESLLLRPSKPGMYRLDRRVVRAIIDDDQFEVSERLGSDTG